MTRCRRCGAPLRAQGIGAQFREALDRAPVRLAGGEAEPEWLGFLVRFGNRVDMFVGLVCMLAAAAFLVVLALAFAAADGNAGLALTGLCGGLASVVLYLIIRLLVGVTHLLVDIARSLRAIRQALQPPADEVP
jgi:hypothetical protein